MHNLILSGGVDIGHDFDDNASALMEQLSSVGFQSELETNIEAGLSRLNNGQYGLLTVMALRWQMQDNPKYKPYRDQWAFSLSLEGRENLRRFVQNGGGLLGLHTAIILVLLVTIALSSSKSHCQSNSSRIGSSFNIIPKLRARLRIWG